MIEKEDVKEKHKEKVEQPKIEGEALIAFIKILHGSYWPVWKIRDAFQVQYPKISGRIIKKKIASIATKEKQAKDYKVIL